MYTHYSMNVQAAKERQRDLLAQAERERRVRRFRDSASASEPAAIRPSRSSWHLPSLRPQAQS